MRHTIAKGIYMGVIATFTGLILQCASDPSVTKDGGLIDQMLVDVGLVDTKHQSSDLSDSSVDGKTDLLFDSIGPKADASSDASISSSMKRTTLTGKTNSSGHVDIKGVSFNAKSLPIITVWTKSTGGWWKIETTVEVKYSSSQKWLYIRFAPKSTDYQIVIAE